MGGRGFSQASHLQGGQSLGEAFKQTPTAFNQGSSTGMQINSGQNTGKNIK